MGNEYGSTSNDTGQQWPDLEVAALKAKFFFLTVYQHVRDRPTQFAGLEVFGFSMGLSG